MSARGTHAPNFVNREGVTYGHFTVMWLLGSDHQRRSVWRCRCDCGRPDCRGTVDLNSLQLGRHTSADCRHRAWVARPAKPRPVAVAPTLPEGVKVPWARPADTRAARDARLLDAFSGGGDLR